MTPIVIQASRRKWVVLLIGALCFVAGGVLARKELAVRLSKL